MKHNVADIIRTHARFYDHKHSKVFDATFDNYVDEIQAMQYGLKKWKWARACELFFMFRGQRYWVSAEDFDALQFPSAMMDYQC